MGTNDRLAEAPRWVAIGVLGLLGSVGVVHAIVRPPHASLAARPAITVDAAGATADGLPPGEAEAGVRSASVARLVDINSAGAAELDLLPGIGPALASRIIEHREVNGPFSGLDGLDAVSGIGPKTIAKLAPYAEAR